MNRFFKKKEIREMKEEDLIKTLKAIRKEVDKRRFKGGKVERI